MPPGLSALRRSQIDQEWRAAQSGISRIPPDPLGPVGLDRPCRRRFGAGEPALPAGPLLSRGILRTGTGAEQQGADRAPCDVARIDGQGHDKGSRSHERPRSLGPCHLTSSKARRELPPQAGPNARATLPNCSVRSRAAQGFPRTPCCELNHGIVRCQAETLKNLRFFSNDVPTRHGAADGRPLQRTQAQVGQLRCAEPRQRAKVCTASGALGEAREAR